MGQQKLEHVHAFDQKLLGDGMFQHKILHILIQPRMGPQLRNIERVGQKAHVKDQIALARNAALEAKAKHLHAQRRLGPGVEDDLLEHFLQRTRTQVGGIDQVICRLTQGHEAVALLTDGFVQRQPFAAEGVIPARFLVAVDQHLIAGFDKQRIDVKAHQPGFIDHLGNRLGVEKLAAAHICGYGNHGVMKPGVLACLHKRHQHHGRQIVHAQGPKVLQIANRHGFARAAHSCQNQKMHTRFLAFVSIFLSRRRPRPRCVPPAPDGRRFFHTRSFAPGRSEKDSRRRFPADR